LPFRITKAVERAAIRHSVADIVLTERVRDLLFSEVGVKAQRVIPCCADTEQIAAQRGRRDHVRAELDLSGRLVLIYVGKFSGWYMEREMVEFFVEAHNQQPRLYFHILTQHDRGPITREFARAGVSEHDYSIAQVRPDEVAAHLVASDAAISFIRPCPSKISSSPTKIGEYLAAGLPIVTSTGIGDVDTLVGRDGIGVLVESFDRDAYSQAARQLWAAVADPRAISRRMSLAEERLSLQRVGIPAYDAVYRMAAAEINRVARAAETAPVPS
jgi:glycosyltransferase involved in cell wall biosynthesis